MNLASGVAYMGGWTDEGWAQVAGPKLQSGFRPRHLTEIAILRVTAASGVSLQISDNWTVGGPQDANFDKTAKFNIGLKEPGSAGSSPDFICIGVIDACLKADGK